MTFAAPPSFFRSHLRSCLPPPPSSPSSLPSLLASSLTRSHHLPPLVLPFSAMEARIHRPPPSTLSPPSASPSSSSSSPSSTTHHRSPLRLHRRQPRLSHRPLPCVSLSPPFQPSIAVTSLPHPPLSSTTIAALRPSTPVTKTERRCRPPCSLFSLPSLPPFLLSPFFPPPIVRCQHCRCRPPSPPLFVPSSLSSVGAGLHR